MRALHWFIILPALAFLFERLGWVVPMLLCLGLWCGLLGWDMRDSEAQFEKRMAEWDALMDRLEEEK